MSAHYHCLEFMDIVKKEKERIEQHRRNRNNISNKWIGLAISGGGIRSASFGLGALQALNKYQVLDKLDYLSTVSGGGFIGSSLTWFNHLQKEFRWQFPLGKQGQGARSTSEHTALDYIRQHGDYLTPGKNLSPISFLATVLRNILLSSAVYFAILVFLVFVAIDYGFVAKPFELPEGALIDWSKLASTAANGALLSSGLFIIVTALYGIGTFVVSGTRLRDYWLRVTVQKILGWVVTLVIALALLASLPIAFAFLKGGGTLAVGATASTAGVVGGIYEFIRQRSAKTFALVPNKVRIGITTFLLIYGLLLLAYSIAGDIQKSWELAKTGSWFLLPGLAFGFFINTNYFGIGRMYRDRLAETFLPDPKTIETGKWNLAIQADRAKLSEMCGGDEHGPYHLINCNVVLVDSEVAKYQGRGGDSFLLSPLYSGSDATGWYETRDFLKNGMTLATAMAISGAAANPNSGVGGRGPTRNRLVSFLMAFLGARLGYWAKNPFAKGFQHLLARITVPNLLYPGIVQGLLGQRLNAKAGYLELSDGGHFENTGLYELARRKLDVIIVLDAGADPKFAMSDLGNAIERIRVDFGYYIRFTDDNYGLSHIEPRSSGDSLFDEKYDLATRGFAVGSIEYGPDHRGTIVYIKATMIRHLPGDVYAYKKAFPEFPHQSTTDQFFDEMQLEAYRELGYQLCKDMLKNNDDGKNWV